MKNREYVYKRQNVRISDAEKLLNESVRRMDINGTVVKRACKTPDMHINFNCRVNNQTTMVAVYSYHDGTCTFSAKQAPYKDLSDDICLVTVGILEKRVMYNSKNTDNTVVPIILRDKIPNAISLIENDRIINYIETILLNIDDPDPEVPCLLKDLNRFLLIKHMTINWGIDYAGRHLDDYFIRLDRNYNSFFLSAPDLTSGYQFQLKGYYCKQIVDPEKISIIEKIMSIYDFYSHYMSMSRQDRFGDVIIPNKFINRKYSELMFELINDLTALDNAA